jgi:hypothetical protein
MRLDRVIRINSRLAASLAGVLALTAGGVGCNLDKKTIPPLSGPAELGQSVQLTASPDVITADGFSTASVQVVMRGPNGQPLSGVGVFFALADAAGNFGDIGKLSSSSATTGSNGIAQVIYKSPPRTDATANRTIFIEARPISGDANGQLYRRVRLELRSAEPRLFPPVPGNVPPVCNFVMEPATGIVAINQDLLAQTSSFDADGSIVRYEWDFGDGTQEDKPDVTHRYGLPGEYTLTHVVTDNGGIQAACEATVTVQ